MMEVSGKKEDPAEEQARSRLLVKEVNLRKLAKKLYTFVASPDDNADLSSQLQALFAEHSQLELFSTKARTNLALIQAESNHYEQQHAAQLAETGRMRTEVQRLKQELERERLQRKHLEELEILRRTVNTLPARPVTEQ